MNLRLARLELTVAFLQTAAAVKQNQGTTPLSLGAQPAPPVTNDSFDQQTKSNWLPKAQWRQWQIAGVIVILLIGVVLVFGKRLHNRPRILTYRQRIDNILEEAREAAAPLLGTDPALPAGDNFSQPPLYATNIHDDSTIREQAFRSANSANYATDPDAGSWPAESSELESNPNLTTIRLPTAKLTDVDGPLDEVTKVEDREIPPSQYLAVAKSNEAIRVSAEIRQEMTEAIDSSRSMFSDIDRFIGLGRSQNALSLLEFQIKRDPSDRQAWVKMLAIYHQEAMDEEFERTYAAFVEKFGS